MAVSQRHPFPNVESNTPSLSSLSILSEVKDNALFKADQLIH